MPRPVTVLTGLHCLKVYMCNCERSEIFTLRRLKFKYLLIKIKFMYCT